MKFKLERVWEKSLDLKQRNSDLGKRMLRSEQKNLDPVRLVALLLHPAAEDVLQLFTVALVVGDEQAAEDGSNDGTIVVGTADSAEGE